MITKFTAQTFAWLRQINTDKRVLAIDVKIALELTRYFREKDQGGRAYPSAKTLGDAVGLSERSARRSIDRLQQAGHLHVIPGKPGRGCSAQYWMILKTRTATPVFEAQKTGLRDRQKTGIRGKKTGTATPQSLREPILDGECLRTPPSRGREFALTRESISSDPGGRPDGGPGSVSSHGVGARLSPGRETKGNSSEEHRPMLETMANLPCRTVKQAGRGRQSAEKKVSLDHDGDWRTLHSIWQRGHACDSTPRSLAITRNAFAKTCRDTVPAEIIAAAKEHVAAAAAGDGVRYLPQLAQWLAARGWEQPPHDESQEPFS